MRWLLSLCSSSLLIFLFLFHPYCPFFFFFFFSSRRRHTRFDCDWSSDVCSSDLVLLFDLAEALLDAAVLLGEVGDLLAKPCYLVVRDVALLGLERGQPVAQFLVLDRKSVV